MTDSREAPISEIALGILFDFRGLGRHRRTLAPEDWIDHPADPRYWAEHIDSGALRAFRDHDYGWVVDHEDDEPHQF